MARLQAPSFNPNSLPRMLMSPWFPHSCLISSGTIQAVTSLKDNYASLTLLLTFLIKEYHLIVSVSGTLLYALFHLIFRITL